jgi:hypothetical protein
MSPEQREQARRVFGAWRRLPDDRRQLVRDRIRRLQQTPPSNRDALLENEEFLSPLTANERNLLRQLWQLRQTLPPRPPHPPSGPPPRPPGPPSGP